jgi:hypothetical protein
VITLNEYYRKLMLRGLTSAAAANGRDVGDYEELDATRQVLDSHPLDCRCAVCTAYVSAATPALGLMAAMEVREREKRDADSARGKSQVPEKLDRD